MAGLFKANEIMAAAVEIETRGEVFYRKMVERAESDETRKLFTYLAEEETKHRDLFAKLGERLGNVELHATTDDDEYGMYLNDLINSHILFDGGLGETLMDRLKTEQEGIRMAMGFEKDTILFFMEMRELVPAAEKDFVQQCVDEEKDHLRKLSEMLKK